jgi:ribonucleotide reductase beta subunit family protein with ferritin-like domain
MKGTAEQFQYIMRDEVLHATFGIRVVKQILREEGIALDPKALREMWDETEAAEAEYAGNILRDPILGYSAEDHVGQFRYVANRRARQLGGWKSRFQARHVLYPGWTNRPTSARRRTFSRPGLRSIRPAVG